MILRSSLPCGYSLDPTSGLLLPSEARGVTPLRAPFGRRRRARRGVPYPPAGGGGGGGPTAIWSSDWVDAADWTDGGLWAEQSGTPGDSAFVVGGSDSVSGTHLKIEDDDPAIACEMEPATPPNAPSVDGSITWRFYYQLRIPDAYTGDHETHSVGWGSNGGMINSTEWPVGWTFYNNDAGGWSPGLMINAQGFGLRRFTLTRNSGISVFELSKNTWYRFENTFTRTGADTWTVGVAIYNAAGTLLYSTPDFDATPGEASDWGEMSDAVLEADADVLMKFVHGANGITGFTPAAEAYRMAAVCAVYGPSVGPYPITGEGE